MWKKGDRNKFNFFKIFFYTYISSNNNILYYHVGAVFFSLVIGLTRLFISTNKTYWNYQDSSMESIFYYGYLGGD